MKQFFLSLILLFSTNTVIANERTILGLELGAPLNLPECEFKLVKSYMPKNEGETYKSYKGYGETETCITDAKESIGYLEPVKRVYLAKKDMPDYLYSSGLDILESEGNLVEVSVITLGLEFQDAMLARLTEKYGKPSSISNKSVQNRMGASFAVVDATWKTKGVLVRYEGVYDKLERGILTVSLPAAATIKRAWELKKRSVEPKL